MKKVIAFLLIITLIGTASIIAFAATYGFSSFGVAGTYGSAGVSVRQYVDANSQVDYTSSSQSTSYYTRVYNTVNYSYGYEVRIYVSSGYVTVGKPQMTYPGNEVVLKVKPAESSGNFYGNWIIN